VAAGNQQIQQLWQALPLVAGGVDEGMQRQRPQLGIRVVQERL